MSSLNPDSYRNIEAMFLRSLTTRQRRFIEALPPHLRARLSQVLEDARYQDQRTRAAMFADALDNIREDAEMEEITREIEEAMDAMSPQDWADFESSLNSILNTPPQPDDDQG